MALAKTIRNSLLTGDLLRGKYNMINKVEKALNINTKKEILKELNELSLSSLEKERLEREINYLDNCNNSLIYLLKVITDYAKQTNNHYFFRGVIYNSYICYLLKITDINPLDENYPLYNEFLYKSTNLIDADINISSLFCKDVLKYLDDLLNGNIYKAYCPNNSDKLIPHPTKYIILLDDTKHDIRIIDGVKCIFEDCFQLSGQHIDIDFCCFDTFDKIDAFVKKYGYPNKIDEEKIIKMTFFEKKTAGLISYSHLDLSNFKYNPNFSFIDYYIKYFELDINKDFKEEFLANDELYPKTRDQVMKYLLDLGLERKRAFIIANNACKGKYNYGSANIVEDAYNNKNCSLLKHMIPFLKSVRYMFPLGHVIAYAKYDVLIQYYKTTMQDFYEIMLGINQKNE